MEATVAERGQITLPKAVRDALGLSKGTILKVELDGGRIILRKSVDDAISRARGRFKLDGFASTDEAMRAIRGRAPVMDAVLVHAETGAPRTESLFETDLAYYLRGAAPVPQFTF
mgnify:CR=1 FL=1